MQESEKPMTKLIIRGRVLVDGKVTESGVAIEDGAIVGVGLDSVATGSGEG